MCGGTIPAVGWGLFLLGLSPRVRGNPSAVGVRMGGIGSIPACAGEPRQPGVVPRLAPVYPRVCGGTDKLPDGPDGGLGLSPRVRGNLAAPIADGK